MNCNPSTRRFHGKGRQSGIALVITLSLIVLVTMAAVAFLTRATANRSIETSRTNQILAQQLAESAADYTVSSFIQEITNADSSTLDSFANYNPVSPLNMVPAICLTDKSSMRLPDDLNYVNLIRQSTNDPQSLVPETNASIHNSATPSKNGRIVSLARWNAPMLCKNGFASVNQLPNWIYLNQDGGLSKVASTNAIGRFAYNAYDIGGLLDANFAGHPPSIDDPNNSIKLEQLKGTVAGADLRQIPGFTDAYAFVKARSPVNYEDAGAYVTNVLTMANQGFLIPPSNGDLYFSSRQDLIKAIQSDQFGCTTNALPFLTHFTRELSRPSYLNLSKLTNRLNLGNIIDSSALNLTPGKHILPNIQRPFTNEFMAGLSSFDNALDIICESQLKIGNIPIPSADSTTFSSSYTPSFDKRQLIANIIDQFSNNAYPTFISIKGISGYAIGANPTVPYISQLRLYCNTDAKDSTKLDFSIIPVISVINGLSENQLKITVGLEGNPKVIIVYQPADPILDRVTLPVELQCPKTSCIYPLVKNGDSLYNDDTTSSSPNDILIETLGFYYTQSPSIPVDAKILNVSVTLNGTSFFLSSVSEDGKGEVNYSQFGSPEQGMYVPVSPPGSSASSESNSENSANSAKFNNASQSLQAGPPGEASGPALIIYSHDPRTIADAGNHSPPGTSSIPPYLNNVTDVISHPQQNGINCVGELGFVFRGAPFRTVDFVSGSLNSTDSPLLDLCCVFSNTSTGIRAGTLNLNTRHTEVIASILCGTSTNPHSTSLVPIDSSDASSVASTMSSLTAPSPWSSRTQLADLTYNVSLAPLPTIGSDKTGLESIVRALGEIGQVRTWNLLIDVVAQSGKFAGTNTSATNFIVGGEERTWTSVAIDRFTGKVIDRQTEQVQE